MKTGKLYPLDSPVYDTWEKIYESTLAAPATSVTISSLDGNTDEMWLLTFYHIHADTSSTTYLFPNNDTTQTNYGAQRLYGTDTTIGASRATNTQYAFSFGQSGDKSLVSALIYAKSGFVRTFIFSHGREIAGTTVGASMVIGTSWNNTADNITSLVITDSVANGINTGSYVSLYRKIRST